MEARLKILIPTDYSDTAMNAERYAVQLAKQVHGGLVFLHVYQTGYNPSLEPMQFAKVAEVQRQSEMKRIEQHAAALFNSLGMGAGEVHREYHVRAGSNVGKQIIKEAEESNADFIVVGTHGVSSFHKLFFGSHSWDVIKRAPRPVFAVPQGASFSGIKNIVFGMEYREGEIPGLKFLTNFASLFDAGVTVLHITNYILSKEFEKEMFEKFRKELTGQITYPKLKMHLMVNENISEGVHKFCAGNKTDLLVMSPKISFTFRFFFMTNMSMTRKTIFQTRIPLLAIPDSYHRENPEFTEAMVVDTER